MTADFRLDKYLERIGFRGTARPNLDTLTALHAAQVGAIPFECLDPFLRRPVKLDLASLQAKLVDTRRGGYCFEQNVLLKTALESIGFKVTALAGRVRWMAPPDSPLGSRTHMLLKVDLPGGPYLADAGFGGCMIDSPLRFETDIEQRTGMGTYRLGEADGLFSLGAKRPDGWRTMYVFNLEPQIQPDFEVSNWYTSTSPLVPFTSKLIMERVTSARRYKLAGCRFTSELPDGVTEAERSIGGAAELGQILDGFFMSRHRCQRKKFSSGLEVSS
jgi:N-hydroxyarylamine O-acetyltransferase